MVVLGLVVDDDDGLGDFSSILISSSSFCFLLVSSLLSVVGTVPNAVAASSGVISRHCLIGAGLCF